jgi:hypothetical protein
MIYSCKYDFWRNSLIDGVITTRRPNRPLMPMTAWPVAVFSWPTSLTSNAKELLKADWASQFAGKTNYTFNQRRERYVYDDILAKNACPH